MGRLPKALEEKRLKLLALARRRSFESYVRHGRVPEAYERAAAFAMDATKAVDPDVALPPAVPAKPAGGRPTTHYVWRTAGDERVRSSHAARNGHIFSRSAPPPGGHPGTEPNCRCWAAPYYGDPAVPDALLTLQRTIEDDPTGVAPWSRIETLRRPDGSLAQSTILGRDGTRFLSLFSGTQVARLVALPDGHRVRLETSNGVQTIFVDGEPALQTMWSVGGPKVIRARRHVAFLLDDPTDLDSTFDWLDPAPRLDSPIILSPNPMVDLFNLEEGGLGGALGAGLLALYLMQQAAPGGMGVAVGEEPIIAFRAWQVGGESGITPIMVDALTAEQVRQSCKILPEVQTATDNAADILAMTSSTLTPSGYGRRLHKLVKDSFTALKMAFPLAYAGIFAELSINEKGGEVRYGATASTRLDVIEEIPPGKPQFVCDYDVKTGSAQLQGDQLRRQAEWLRARYPDAIIFIIQVNPTQ